jgi:hypothetical protein
MLFSVLRDVVHVRDAGLQKVQPDLLRQQLVVWAIKNVAQSDIFNSLTHCRRMMQRTRDVSYQ